MDNTNMRQPDAEPTQELPIQHGFTLVSATSRRNFLRGAAIATAAATAGGAALTAIAGGTKQSPLHLLNSFGGNQTALSGCKLNSSMCFEAGNGSKSPLHAYQSIPSFQVLKDSDGNLKGTTPPEFFLWFTAQDVPAGTYAITVAIPAGFTVVHDGEEPKGINIDLFLAPPCAAIQCPTGEQLAKYEHHYANLVDLNHVVITLTTDVQVKVYLKFTGPQVPTTGTTYTFSGSISGGSINIGSSVTVTAIV